MTSFAKTRQLGQGSAPSTTSTSASPPRIFSSSNRIAQAIKDGETASERTARWNEEHPLPWPRHLKLPWKPNDPTGTLVDPADEPEDTILDLGKAILIGDTMGDRLGTWVAEDNRILCFSRPASEPYGIHFAPTIIPPEQRVEIPGYSPWQGLLANNGSFCVSRLEFCFRALDDHPSNEDLHEKILLHSVFIGSHEQLEDPIALSRIGRRTLVNFHGGAPRALVLFNRSRRPIEIQAFALGHKNGRPLHSRPPWWTDADEAKLVKIPTSRIVSHRHDSTATHEPSSPAQAPSYFFAKRMDPKDIATALKVSAPSPPASIPPSPPPTPTSPTSTDPSPRPFSLLPPGLEPRAAPPEAPPASGGPTPPTKAFGKRKRP